MRNRLKVVSAALGVLGFALWTGAAVLLLHPGSGGDTSFPYLKACETGIVLGGVSVVGAIALVMAV